MAILHDVENINETNAAIRFEIGIDLAKFYT